MKIVALRAQSASADSVDCPASTGHAGDIRHLQAMKQCLARAIRGNAFAELAGVAVCEKMFRAQETSTQWRPGVRLYARIYGEGWGTGRLRLRLELRLGLLLRVRSTVKLRVTSMFRVRVKVS